MSLMKIASYELRKLTDNERKAVLAHDKKEMENWRIPNAAIGAGAYGTLGYLITRGLPKPARLTLAGLGALGGAALIDYSANRGMRQREQWLNDKNSLWYYNKGANRAIFNLHSEDLV